MPSYKVGIKTMKKSVMLSDSTAAFIQATTQAEGKDPRWSNSINATFDQFKHLLFESMPSLSNEEWESILNVYSGSYFPAHGVPARIASDMMDDAGAISLDELADNYAALVKKIHEMNQTEQLAILYFVQLYWLGDWNNEPDFDSIEAKIMDSFK